MPTVSVVIPSYNSADLIVDAINSVLAQTYKDHEIIVVDDGSSDETVQVVDAITGPIRIIQQSNQGPAAARNNGMRNANGRYIAFLDADDIWLPGKLRKEIEVMESSSENVIVFTDGYLWSPSKPIDQNPILSELYIKSPPEPKLCYLFKVHHVATSSVLFKLETAKKVGYSNESLRGGEDYEFFLRMGALGRVRYIDEPLMAYRQHSQSTSSVVTKENVRSRIWRKLHVRHIAMEKFPEAQMDLGMKLFRILPAFAQYLMLLWWRFRYTSNRANVVKSLWRYGRRLLSW